MAVKYLFTFPHVVFRYCQVVMALWFNGVKAHSGTSDYSLMFYLNLEQNKNWTSLKTGTDK